MCISLHTAAPTSLFQRSSPLRNCQDVPVPLIRKYIVADFTLQTKRKAKKIIKVAERFGCFIFISYFYTDIGKWPTRLGFCPNRVWIRICLLTFGYGQTFVMAVLSSNIGWSLSSDQSWCTLSNVSSVPTEEQYIKISVERNTTDVSRTATIFIHQF